MKHRFETDKQTVPAAPTCWQREAPSACLRIEPAGGEIHIFPFQHLVTASLVRSDEGETLRIVLSNHEVEIVGRNLRELLVALQDFAVKWVRTAPERYQTLAAGDAAMVSSIRITAAD
ncbi:MAG: hypothetical protein M3463_06660 [Verrucomicrobiota bacterium]|nr:hypothetical protein [Verrucomicrobiota bacterium]